MARIFAENWAVPFGIPNGLLKNNDLQFAGKLFNASCWGLGTKHMTTTAYHPKTNGQTRQYDKIIHSQRHHCANEHQDDCDTDVQSLTYAYNAQTLLTTKATPFSLAITRKPPTASGLPHTSPIFS